MSAPALDDRLPWTMQLRAVATKELRGRMRGWRAMAVLTVYLVILCGFTLLLYLAATAGRGMGGGGPPVGKIVFFGVTGLQMGLVALLAPAFSAGTLSGERERQSYDLLLTTPLPAWVLVLGKLVGAMAYLLLVIVAGLPLISLGYLLGGVAPDEIAVAMTLLLVTTLTYGMIGLWLSAHLRGTVASTALAYAVIALPLALIPVLIGLVATILGPLLPDGPPAWMIYAFDLVVSLHPFLAGALTAVALNEGEGLFFYQMNLGRGDVTIISPWLLLTIIYLTLSALLLALSIRRVRPASARRGGNM